MIWGENPPFKETPILVLEFFLESFVKTFEMVNHEGEVKSCHVWGVIRVRSWKGLVTPTCKPLKLKGHLEGEQTTTLLRGRNRSPWLSTTYKSWDDAPSSCSLHFFLRG